jgi:transposase-like protein
MSSKKFTILDFQNKFPNEDACLDYLFMLFYGNLPDFNKYYKVSDRKCYAHSETGKQISPTAGTIFHKSRTPLTKWLYIIFLFSCSRNGVSSYEIERQIGVTHKCAWRMAKQIRELFTKTGYDKKLAGIIEADETYIGGKEKNKHQFKKTEGTQGRSIATKVPVAGLVERKGEVIAKVVSDTTSNKLMPFIKENVELSSTIMTDEWKSYRPLTRNGFNHKKVNHGVGEYVNGEAHTNTLEGFWSQMKRAIEGTHHFVSPKHLQTYVNEFTWKYNHSKSPVHLFKVMIQNLK